MRRRCVEVESAQPREPARGEAGSVVVVSHSIAVAQAFVSALRLSGALAVQVPADLTSDSARKPSSTKLALLVACDSAMLYRQIRNLRTRLHSTTRVLVVGLPNREELIASTFSAGADGVVLAEEPLDAVSTAVDEVLRRGFRTPPSVTARFCDRLVWLRFARGNGRRRWSIARLSTREAEVLSCMARGEGNKDIAVALHIGVQTVKNHVTRILRKLDVRTRFDAVRALGQRERVKGPAQKSADAM